MLVFLLSLVAHADPAEEAAVEAAREAARASIQQGEAHQLKSKYWQTYQGPGFRAVVPSYADPKTTSDGEGRHWSLDLAGPYVLTVHHPSTQDANTAVKARLSRYPGATVTAVDSAKGKLFQIRGPRTHATLGVLQNPLVLVELTAPAGELDTTVANRVWTGFSPR